MLSHLFTEEVVVWAVDAGLVHAVGDYGLRQRAQKQQKGLTNGVDATR